jgi:hypothetical protein
VVTLLARHGTNRYADAIDEIDAFFAARLPGVDRELVVVDNSIPDSCPQNIGRDRVLIGGSNSHWEFSAWDSGLAYLGNRLEDFDLVHLATSAFGALDSRHLDQFGPDMLRLGLGASAAIGHIDYYAAPVVICGESSQAWIRTSWMFIPPEEVRLLGSLVSARDGRAFFSGRPEAPFRDDAPLSANCRDYIVGWLTGDGTGLRGGAQWHSRFQLTAETLAYFEAKSMAILNEQLLSIRLRQQGCGLADATWLAGRQAEVASGQRLASLPTWVEQVAERERWPTRTRQTL